MKSKNAYPYKAKVLEDVKEAAEEMKLIEESKLKALNAEDYSMSYEVKSVSYLKRN